MKKILLILAIAILLSCSNEEETNCGCVYVKEQKQTMYWSNGTIQTFSNWTEQGGIMQSDCENESEIIILESTEQVSSQGTLVTENRWKLKCD